MANEAKSYKDYERAYKGYHYSVLKPEMLDYLHATTLKMLKIIIPILEKEKIRYFICDSTLLGAITLADFIPWDDDIDLCVLEEDYEKMTAALLSQLPDWMLVQCKATEPNYYHGWIKIRDRNSHIYPDEPLYACNGVFIDLYKLSLVNTSEVEYLIAREHLDYLDRRYRAGGISQEERDQRIKSNDLYQRMNTAAQAAQRAESEKGDVFLVWSPSKTLVEPVWCFHRKRYSFEGMELYSFFDAERYLIRKFGDNFRTLPQEEKRQVTYNRVDVL